MATSPRRLWDFQEHKREKKHWGWGQQKLVSAGLTLRCDFSIPLPIIRTCSTTHVGTAHGSVSSGMLQIKITLFMFSSRLKFYTGMALVKMSIKSKSDSMLPVNIFPHRVNIFRINYTMYATT